MSTDENLKLYIHAYMLNLNVDIIEIEKSIHILFNPENFEEYYEEFYKLTYITDLYVNLTKLFYEILCLCNYKYKLNPVNKTFCLRDKKYFYCYQNNMINFSLYIADNIDVCADCFIEYDEKLFPKSMHYCVWKRAEARHTKLKLIRIFYYENDIRLLLNDKPKDVVDVIFSYFYGDTYIKNKNKLITLKDFLKENLKKELIKINVNKYSLF